MTVQVAIVGIDGSGKSTLAASLAAVLAAEHGLVVGSAVGADVWIRSPDIDLAGPGFHPHGYAVAARLNRFFRALSRLVVDHKALYPGAKVIQMLLQDNAAAKLSSKYQVDVMVSDGNLLLSGAGRAFNYRGPADNPPSTDDIDHAFQHLLQGTPIGPESRQRLPDLRTAEMLANVARLTRLQGIWIPDQAVFLDLSPDAAADRVTARGEKVDRHENPADLTIARAGYTRVLEVMKRMKGAESVYEIEVGPMRPGAVLSATAQALAPVLPANSSNSARAGALHEATGRLSAARRVLSYQYLVRYLLRHFFDGAWREPLFPLSAPGRAFLKDGYSAGVMRFIYDQPESPSPLDRAFYGYPLHRAVRDRLAILSQHIEAELRRRLATGAEVRIFTAPSGFAYDLRRPLVKLANENREQMRRILLVAADLDPAGDLGPELAVASERIGVRLEFVRGDLTASDFRSECERHGPFDLGLFVGLSSWLPKKPMLEHMRWIHSILRPDGLLVTDCFTPAAYAVGGAAMGYRANYYPPAVMRTLLDYCGFDGLGASVESGRDGINHVILAGVEQRVS
ncbi:MAG TPA: class I SAM-dependent methyltransferase [Candidatus Dormibacteraeota bacterium]|nr:class I SAM-dependent methyltransferase [Candidatus Dormibacteraeota bacterium]